MSRVIFRILFLMFNFSLTAPAISYSASTCEKFYLRSNHKNISDHIRAKYNTKTVLAVKFSYFGLLKIQQLYHQLPVSRVVDDVITNADRDWAEITDKAPTFLKWNQFENSFLSINPTYFKSHELIDAIRNNDVSLLKDRENGIALISWFVHPNLKEKQSIGSFKKGIKIKDIDAPHARYYASILDLTHQDLPYLKDLKSMAVEHLKSLYNVNPQKDAVRFDFHFPYAIDTATLHLHVRVNSPDHPLELSKSYSIDEVIHYLESGRSVADLILDRQKLVGWFYFSISAKKIFEIIPVESSKEVPNPFLL